ncbi:MAG: aminopeptidase P N-terminal domain-containing protein [Kofleriaceae bacterium]
MLDPAVFAARREAYMAALGPTAVAVVRSLPERLRNGDAHHVYRQCSDLIYLTGFLEPETTLVLRPGAETERVVMFVRPRDPELETWDGRRAGLEGAKARYGADAAYASAELPGKLWELVANHDELHYRLGLDPEMDRQIGEVLARLRRLERKGKRPPRAVIDPIGTLHELRLHKRPEELAALRTASQITSEAHVRAMGAGRPGVSERELEGLLNFTFRRRGGNGPGYNSIVGSGDNATILHYIENDRAIAAGDLVLVDAGCEYEHYTADITRTWPASGRFTAPQREVYAAVLAVQQSAIALAVPGATIDQIHQHCVAQLTEAMLRLGLLTGTVEARIADQGYRAYYMHGTSHWLGLDVHDAGAYFRDGAHRPLVPGMVITVEPGLYIAAGARDVPDALRGIGVRIEDDVVITEGAPEVITAACPKEIEAVEHACAR